MSPISDSDVAVSRELAELGARLEMLAETSAAVDPVTTARELGAIRAQLRLLAEDNAAIHERLADALGLVPSGDR